jgi:biopolymer transport protein ExbB/TolQ
MRTITLILTIIIVIVIWFISMVILIRQNRRLRQELRRLRDERGSHRNPPDDAS